MFALSLVQLFVTPWTGIFLARVLEGAATSSSEDLPDRGIEPMSPASPALAGGFITTLPPGKSFSVVKNFFLITTSKYLIVRKSVLLC